MGNVETYKGSYVAVWIGSSDDNPAGWFPARIVDITGSSSSSGCMQQTLTHVTVRWYGNARNEFRSEKIQPGWGSDKSYVYQKTRKHGSPYTAEVYIETVMAWGVRVVGGRITQESLDRIDDAALATAGRLRDLGHAVPVTV